RSKDGQHPVDALHATAMRKDQAPIIEANAHRIVVCVNACAGMADPAAEIEALRRDNAALRAKLADAVDKLTGSTERMEMALAAMDKYNAATGSHIVGPSLLGLGVQIAGNRETLARIQGEN
ncbi:hypothetical protein RZS08_09985, partial [Arthrospira platensis SPKY1]|nr:hypothetical protein [Arthrospira platensis SPKY1]